MSAPVPARMKRTRRGLLAAGVAAAGLAGCLGLGGRRDVVRLETLDVGGSPGTEVALRPREGVALVDFFATWCAPCRPQMATLGAVREAFSESELRMTSVTGERDADAVRSFWREYDGRWPVALDPEGRAAEEYRPTGLPTLVLVEADGTERWRHQGLAAEDRLLSEVRGAVEG